MNFLYSLYTQISRDNFLTAITVGFFIAWLFWRFAKAEERNSVLESLKKELEIHKNWMSGEYFTNVIADQNWRNPGYIVFKLSTVAIDNAISKGSWLFLNKKLVTNLTFYRQKVNAFNQLIENAQFFQANPNLWTAKPQKQIVNRMIELTGTIHWYGVGNSLDATSANSAFKRVWDSLEEEGGTKFFYFLWLITALNLFPVRKILIKYL